MDDTSSFRKKWLYIVGWLVILLVAYGWQIVRMGGFVASEVDIFVDLFCLFPVLLVLWMAFFAQFVLPVRTFRDRQKIFDRLITYLFGRHGPAIFIRNGELIKREGEERKKGPGVLWLDSASAAVTRTAVAIKQTIGPGVHFIENRETIAGTVDLHIQSQKISPKESDNPFEEKKEGQSDEEYKQVQDRRKQVSALTRDGIEVVPDISVTFRVDTGFPKDGKPGSRFGYRTGVTEKDRENEKRDKEAIRKAILGEGINPNIQPDSPRHRVAWNQLPALLAVDLWREYVAKFTLDELFRADKIVPPPPPQLPQPTEEEIDPLSQPLQFSSRRETLQDALAVMIHQINLLLARMIRFLEGSREDKVQKRVPETPSPQPADKKEIPPKTALQVINDIVKARLTQANVDFLDDHGERRTRSISSPEFDILQRRRLRVLSVSISNLRLNPTAEEQIIKQWSATWLNHAKAESERIDRRRNIIEATAQEQAIRRYAEVLSREINDLAKKGKPHVKESLKLLLMRSRSLIRSSEPLRRRMSTELQDIEDMIRWIEVNGS